ncbi:AcvB/VirJ family lysyl-phosphatidylglycerol hydrolase [Sphingomonas sp. DG1-23]|uniref:AcvB/VirJ family lysyl-phosphatidylglycerol hydrolase n=1 Tax=Sphingomonas sp. DG1-23 TaxID=3068316 RepID=UPI00273F12FF|nr:AcvB/VirJ family lysyl-phosphatidylglycerol hydrolase [Sphingomonas sp. DG1-23]MDP5279494.1 AcvB/VirJ family lysyl-phosphatidylglycerol hydrolase [Sphingomonas sp. DG1-23]
MLTRRMSRLRGISRIGRALGIGVLACAAAAALGLAAPALHLLDGQAVRLFASGRPNPRVAALYFSGDMGLRFGMGPKVAPALAARGLPVLGISSAVNFATHRTRAELDAILADAIRAAVARTGASKVVLIGQSFGADMIATAAPDLPVELRERVAAIGLVVPSRTVFFRADPTGITYLGTPDARPALAVRALDWAPIICIYGVRESESLCPALDGTHARVIALPGGHFLNRDDKLLVATIVDALHAADPGIIG